MIQSLETFFDAWSETDAGTRDGLLDRVTAPDIRYADPRSAGVLEGRAALGAYLGQFSANAPGWTASVVASDDTSGMIRATVAFGGKGPDGSEVVQHGQYFAEFDGAGQITRLTGFVGTGAPEGGAS